MEVFYLMLLYAYLTLSIGLWNLFFIEWVRGKENIIDYFKFTYNRLTIVGKILVTISFLPAAFVYYVVKYLSIFLKTLLIKI